MRQLRSILILFLMLGTFSFSFAGNSDKLTADEMYQMASGLQEQDFDHYKQLFDQMSAKEKARLVTMAIDDAREAKSAETMDASVGLLILAIILPPLAVGIYTDWGTPTLWNLLFTLIGWVPGIIHAFYILLV